MADPNGATSDPPVTRVLVAGGSAVVRAGLEAVLSADTGQPAHLGPEGRVPSPGQPVPSSGQPVPGQGLSVIGSVSNLSSLPETIAALEPDVVLVELDGGLERLPLLGAGGPALVLLVEGPEPDLADAIRSGARAVLPREAEAEEIVAAVHATAAGLMVLHPDAVESLLPALAAPASRPADTMVEPLTAREVEVLTMLAEGAGNKQIARRLGISEHTVKFHVGSILAKLRASSRTEAVTIGVRQGLIML